MLLGIFAALALMLAAVGIYGVMSYSVAQRTRRSAFAWPWARRGDVLKMTVKQGLNLVVMGVAIGGGNFRPHGDGEPALRRQRDRSGNVRQHLADANERGNVRQLYSALRATKVDPMVALRAQ
jgi:putative ABC transport system permease protein